METKQIAVILLIVAIALSIVTIVIAFNVDFSGYRSVQPQGGTNYINTNFGPSGAGVGIAIVPPTGGNR